jgi:hypothetical protein
VKGDFEPIVLPELDMREVEARRKLLGHGAIGTYWRSPREGIPVPEAEREWWLYFVQGDDGGPIKIGRTRKPPQHRIDALQAGYPYGRLRLVGLIRAHLRLETELHAKFYRLRLLGEWFEPGAELVNFIVTLPKTEGPCPT